MNKILWDSEALNDLKKIWSYIASDSLKYADITRYEIINTVEKLRNDAFLGPAEPLLTKLKIEYRYLLYSHYKIIYSVKEKNIFIIVIFDTRQKPSKLVKRVKK